MNFSSQHKIYLSPFNEPTRKLKEKLLLQGVEVLGFVDEYKSGDGIFKSNELKEYDFIIIDSPFYWKEIAKNFQKEKVILFKNESFIAYDKYKKQLLQIKNYDVVCMPYNRSNVIDASLVVRELRKQGLSGCIVDFPVECYGNFMQGVSENSDIDIVDFDALFFMNYKAFVCAIDWDRYARKIIAHCKQKSIPTIGLVDGVEDFEDIDYKKYNYERMPYESVEYVYVVGRYDMKFLAHKKDKCDIVGLPKMYALYHEEFKSPKEVQVMINVNFTYGFFEECRDEWLKQVLNVCKKLNLKYIISHHHADKGDMSGLNVSKKDVYDTMRESSLIISRYSTVLSEALSLGKKAIYHNPHGEEVKIYKNAQNAFSSSFDEASLEECINKELEDLSDNRKRAFEFLDEHFNIGEKTPPAVKVAQNIKKLIK